MMMKKWTIRPSANAAREGQFRTGLRINGQGSNGEFPVFVTFLNFIVCKPVVNFSDLGEPSV